MYKVCMFFLSICVSVFASAQQIKMSGALFTQSWVESKNGYKKMAGSDRGLFIEYEKKLKLYSWSYNAAIGFSRLNYNQRVESLNSDTYNSAYFLHFRPLGLKKYFRAGKHSSIYLELLLGVDYVPKLVQKPERPDLPDVTLKDLGFSVGSSAKAGFKINFNGGRNAFDFGFNPTTDIYSGIYLDKAEQSQKFKVQRTSLYITFYRTLRDEK